MKTTQLLPGIILGLSIAAFADDSFSSEVNTNTMLSDDGAATVTPRHPNDEQSPEMPPLKPYPRLLPLQLIAPATAQASIPLAGISVRLLNPGDEAPDARLRLIIHDKNHRDAGNQPELNPDNIKVEVQEGGVWKPVVLGMAEDGVMGAIGAERVSVHRERHQRGGFAIPAGLNKTWQLRVTFNLPGTYSVVAAVSPDNGSRHLAQPAHSIIEVQ